MSELPLTCSRTRDARWAAYQATLAALRGEGFIGETLAALRSATALAPREAGLAMEIALGAVRHLVTIEHVLQAVARLDPQRMTPQLRALLSNAAYQVIYLDRIPEFAAVDEAVELTRAQINPRLCGLVNASLRNLVRAIVARKERWAPLDPARVRVGWESACVFNQAVLPVPLPTSPQSMHAHVAAATGERQARYEALRRNYPEHAEQIAWAEQATPAVVLHRNSLRLSGDEFYAAITRQYGVEGDWGPDVAFLPAGSRVVELELLRNGDAFVQDATANEAAMLLKGRPGERVLDLCAAPGGKSIALALEMKNQGEIIACDLSSERLAILRDNAERLGITILKAVAVDDDDRLSPQVEGVFDAAIVDAPCSNSGVIARRPEARLGLSPTKLRSLTQLQAGLLRRAASRVRSGGRLVYCTCSLEPEENEQIVAAFLRADSDWVLETAETQLPAWGARPADWRDGGFAARIRRKR